MVVKGICIISLTLGVGILLRFMPSIRAGMLWREAYWRQVVDKNMVVRREVRALMLPPGHMVRVFGTILEGL